MSEREREGAERSAKVSCVAGKQLSNRSFASRFFFFLWPTSKRSERQLTVWLKNQPCCRVCCLESTGVTHWLHSTQALQLLVVPLLPFPNSLSHPVCHSLHLAWNLLLEFRHRVVNGFRSWDTVTQAHSPHNLMALYMSVYLSVMGAWEWFSLLGALLGREMWCDIVENCPTKWSLIEHCNR